MVGLKLKNIFFKVTYRMLMKNKVRTLVTILGIILSTALITAIATFISSLQHSMLEFKISETGNWHGEVMSVDDGIADGIRNDSQVVRSSSLYNLGYAHYENSDNDSRMYLNVEAADDAFINNISITVTSGRMPQNSSEILLPVNLSEADQTEYQLGQQITLQLGERVDADGKVVDQANQFASDSGKYKGVSPQNVAKESLINQKATQYTVVGFFKRPPFESYDEPGYMLLTVHGSNERYYGRNVFFELNNPKNIYNYMKNYETTHITTTNDSVLSLLGVTRYSGILSAIYGLATIVIVLVVMGSVLLIYSSFAISVNERTRQFGLLSSIGATRKQLRKSVLFEASFVGIIGIPVGIVVGIVGIAATLFCLKSSIKRMTAQVVSVGNLNLYISWKAVAVAVLVAIVTVLLSSMIPMIRISRISAIEAVRETQDIKVNVRKIKCSKLFYKLFGFEGLLARKNFKRSRKKYRVTVLTLFVSVVMFITAAALGRYMMKGIDELYKTDDYQIKYSASEQQDTTLFEQMKNVPGVTRAGTAKQVAVKVSYDKKDLTPEYLNLQAKEQKTTVAELPNSFSLNASLFVVDDDTYRDYLVQNHLSPEKYMNAEQPLMIAFAQYRQKDRTAGKVTMIPIFNQSNETLQASATDAQKQKELYAEHKEQLKITEDMTSEERQNRTDLYKNIQEQSQFSFDINIGVFTENLPFVVPANVQYNGISIVCSDSVYQTIIQGHTDNIPPDMYFQTSDHNQAFQQIKQVLDDHSLNSSMLFDVALTYESEASIIFIIRVFSFGFIILMSLIAIANVFNTVSTNLILRQREFAMLKSIGLTEKGFNKMMYYECFMYGLKALVLAIPVSLLFTYWIYKQMDLIWSTGYYVPVAAILIAIFSVFAVVFITMMYAKRKINQLNLIDVIKNENV